MVIDELKLISDKGPTCLEGFSSENEKLIVTYHYGDGVITVNDLGIFKWKETGGWPYSITDSDNEFCLFRLKQLLSFLYIKVKRFTIAEDLAREIWKREIWKQEIWKNVRVVKNSNGRDNNERS